VEAIAKSALEHRFDRLREPFKQFLRTQRVASGLLLLSLAAALLMVNGGWKETYQQIQQLTVAVQLGSYHLSGNLLGWVDDGLITIFFFLIGLEIKRELLAGELQQRERRSLLIAAALGGMAAPAAIYAVINAAGEQGVIQGWGIPMATDTALAIGVLAMLRDRLPAGLTGLLVGLAIVDDIGAVLVIAFFYTSELSWLSLGVAAAAFLVLLLGNYAGLRHPLFYLIGGMVLWLSVHHGGIHASIAGVVAALTVPARPRTALGRLELSLRRLRRRLRGQAKRSRDVLADAEQHAQIAAVEREARRATTPLRRWEDALDLPVALFILPAFVFLNAGIEIDTEALRNLTVEPVSLGIVAGLVAGKPLGIMGAAFLATRLGVSALPAGIGWRHLLGLGLVAGIGFTMSTFIANLAMASEVEGTGSAKLAILAGSLTAGTAGLLVLWAASRPRAASGDAHDNDRV
jgi:NhaA family Na+:H+ antiporter